MEAGSIDMVFPSGGETAFPLQCLPLGEEWIFVPGRQADLHENPPRTGKAGPADYDTPVVCRGTRSSRPAKPVMRIIYTFLYIIIGRDSSAPFGRFGIPYSGYVLPLPLLEGGSPSPSRPPPGNNPEGKQSFPSSSTLCVRYGSLLPGGKLTSAKILLGPGNPVLRDSSTPAACRETRSSRPAKPVLRDHSTPAACRKTKKNQGQRR